RPPPGRWPSCAARRSPCTRARTRRCSSSPTARSVPPGTSRWRWSSTARSTWRPFRRSGPPWRGAGPTGSASGSRCRATAGRAPRRTASTTSTSTNPTSPSRPSGASPRGPRPPDVTTRRGLPAPTRDRGRAARPRRAEGRTMRPDVLPAAPRRARRGRYALRVHDLRRVSDVWRRMPVMARDLPFPLVLFALSLLPAFRGNGTQLGDLPARPYDALAVAAIALQCFPLVVRRRLPAVCVVLVAVGLSIDQLRGSHTFAGPALPIALISAAAHLERHRRTLIVLLSAGYAALAVALGRIGSDGVEVYVVFYLALAGAWGIGAWLRSSRAAEAERRRHIAEATRAAERTRIARELHDVVTHHVTA